MYTQNNVNIKLYDTDAFPYWSVQKHRFHLGESLTTSLCPADGLAMDVVRATGSFVRDLSIYLTVELHPLQVFFIVDRLMENVRVKRAGFVFRQEYDVALERYIRFSFLFSQEDVAYICKAVVC